MLDGRKKKTGLFDSLSSDDRNYHKQSVDSLVSAQKKYGDSFDFQKWQKGWTELDQSAIRYFKNCKQGTATQDGLTEAMNKNMVIQGEATKTVAKGLWDTLDPKKQKSYKQALQYFNEQNELLGGDFDFNQFASGYQKLDKSALNYFKTCTNGKATVKGLQDAMNAQQFTVTESVSAFTNLQSKIGSAIKSFGKGLASGLVGAAINVGISLLLQKAGEAWKNYSNMQENAIESSQTALASMEENQKKIASAQQTLDSITDNTVKTTNGTTITRFEQLSKGVNSLGENISLTKSEFEEYNSIISQLEASGFKATNSMSNLNQQFKDMRTNTNNETLSGLDDWVEGFNALNNQEYTDGTKEIGFQQKLRAVNEILKGSDMSIKSKSVGDKIAEGLNNAQKAMDSVRPDWLVAINDFFRKIPIFNPDNAMDMLSDMSEVESTNLKAITEIGKELNLDIFDKHGEVIEEKLLSDDVRQKITDYSENMQSQIEATVAQSSGYLQALFENSSQFDQVSESAQSAISSIFTDIDYDTISKYMMDSNDKLSRNLMEDWVKGISEGVTDKNVQKQLDELYSLTSDPGTINFDTFKRRADSLVKGINAAVPELSKDLLRKTAGIDQFIEDYEGSFNKVVEKFGLDKANSLSMKEIEIGANILAKDNFSGTFQEFLGYIYEAQAALDLDASPMMDAIAAATESKNRGADYESAVSYLETAKDLYDKGLTGTDDFKSVSAYLSPTGADDPENFMENYKKATRYLTEDSSGVENFLTDLEKKGYATFETLSDGTKQWDLDIKDLEATAQNMGIGFEFMMDMFGRLEDYGAIDNFVGSLEDGEQKLEKLSSQLAQEQMKLFDLEKNDPKNKTAIDAQREKVEQLKNSIIEVREAMNELLVHSAEEHAEKIKTNRDMIKQAIAERDQIQKDQTYGEDTQLVVDAMNKEIQALASESGLELDASVNLVAEDVKEEVNNFAKENKVEIPLEADISNMDMSELEKTKETLTELKEEAELKFGADSSELDYLEGKLQQLEERKDVLLTVDVAGEEDISTLGQMLQSLPKDEQSNVSVNIQNEEQLSNVVDEISKIPKDTPVSLSFTVQNQEQASALQSQLDQLNSESGKSITYTIDVVDNTGSNLTESKKAQVYYEYGGQDAPENDTAQVYYEYGGQDAPQSSNATGEVNFSANTLMPDSYTPENKEAEVKFGVNDAKVQAYDPPDKNAKVNYTANTSGLPSSFPSITRYVKYEKTGDVEVNGTAHALGTAPKLKFARFNDGYLGTAHASGNWGLKQDERALIGELGPEIVVRGSQFFTIGDHGAEFANLKRGDIVFNHLQSKQLLEKGYVTGRGKMIGGNAHAEGTALAGGGFHVNLPKNTGSTSKNNSSSAAKAAQNSAKAAKNSAQAAKDSKDASENINDWLEIYLERLQHTLDEFTNLAENYYTAYKKQNESLDKAISQTKTNIKANEDGYAYYMQKAREVGLSNDYQAKVMSGQINIETITNENLQKQISEFQELYEKAQDCRDTIIDLNAQIRELSMQKIENITNDYDSYVDLIDSIRGHYESYNDLLEAQGKSKSVSALKTQQEQANNAAKTRRAELDELRKEQERLVSSGAILKWSEEWHMIEKQAHDITAEIYKNEAAVYELRQEIREVQWQPFHDALYTLDAMNDDLESTLSLVSDLEAFGKDSDVLNTNGKIQLGLLTKQLGNAKQSVAEYENAMKVLRDELNKGYLSEEQYKEELRELTDGRNDAVASVKQYRDAILDLVKEGIEKETESMQKLVDKRKEALQAQKDADDYAKSVRDKNTEINKIKAQIAALEGDDSAAAKAKMRQLQEQLNEANQELKDMQDDREYDLLQQGYDDAMDKFEETQENELYNLNSNLEAQNKAIENILASAKDAYSLIFSELQNLAEIYGFTLSEELTNPWKNAEEALHAYQDATGKLNSNININTGVSSLQGGSHYVDYAESAPAAPDNNVQATPPPAPPAPAPAPSGNIAVGGRINAGGALIYKSPGGRGARQYFRNDPIYTVLSDQNGWLKVRWHGTNSGVTGWFKKGDVRSYKTGGLVDYTGLAQLDGTPTKPEMVLNAKDTKNFIELKDTLKDLSASGKLPVLSDMRPKFQMISPNLTGLQSGNSRTQNLHFDALINVEGNLTEDVLPKVQSMITSAIFTHDKQVRINIANDYRKIGGRRK